jgi:hypothetical protein
VQPDQPPKDDPSTAEPIWDREPYKTIRQGAAVVILLVALGSVAASYLPNSPVAACRATLTSAGSVVTICRPLGTDDIVLIGLVLLVAGLCLAPDLSEVGISGLVSLKRRVREEAKRAAEVRREVEGLVASQPIPDLTQAVASADLKGQETAPDEVVSPTDQGGRILSAERTLLERRLSKLINNVDEYRSMSDPDRVRRDPYGDLGGAPLRRWRSRFAHELATFAGVRTVFRSAPERLSDEDVEKAVNLGERLVDEAQRSITANQLGSTAEKFVIWLERTAGRKPRPVSDPTIDISSPPRSIGVKASARSLARVSLTQAELDRAVRDPSFYLYVLDELNVANPAAVRIRVVPGHYVAERAISAGERLSLELSDLQRLSADEALAGPLKI